MRVRVRVLGSVGVSIDGTDVAIPSGKPTAVLAMLALAGRHAVTADQLVAGLWGEDAPPAAWKTLQVHVSTLRSRLRGTGVEIEHTAGGYVLVPGPDGDVDIDEFERHAEDGLAALAAGRVDDASRSLRGALAVRSGDPLSNVADTPFAAHESDRLRLRHLVVLQGRVDADLALGLGATLVDEIRSVAVANPYDERACAQLMVALYRAGQPAAALDAYRKLRTSLGDGLGLEPGPGLVELERQVLMHDERLLARPAVGTPQPHNLPAEVSSFVGRAAEVRDVTAAVATSRLVTLAGAGGSGKTRLATTVAAGCLDEFPDGVRLVELAPLSAAELVVPAIAEAVGARVDDGLDGLADAIGLRRLLLILDNCEHLIDDVASIAGVLPRRCRNLRMIVTSREALSVDGEQVYRVPPLGLPRGDTVDVGTALASDAVALFVDRAQWQIPGFALDDDNVATVVAVCARLDGLPLAIELAAARLRTLPLDELARHLDERFRLLTGSSRRALGRQQTLRALIDWSYDLLDDDERLLLDQVSVFAGGFALNAVEAIARESIGDATPDPVATLLALVEKSLVEVSGNPFRFRLLETIREYAAGRLASRPEVVARTTRRAHARHYLQLAEAAAPSLEHGSGQRASLEQLDAERDNLRVAAELLVDDPGQGDDGLRLVRALSQYWESRSQFAEGSGVAVRMLERAGDGPPSRCRVLARCSAAVLLERTGDLEFAAELAAVAVTEAAELGESELYVEAVLTSAFVHACREHFEIALRELDGLADRERSVSSEILLHNYRAFALQGLDDLPAARWALEQALGAAVIASNERRQAQILSNLAVLDIADGALAAAEARLDESQVLAARLRDDTILGHLTLNRAVVALLQGDHALAWTRYREALLFFGPVGQATALLSTLIGLAACCSAQGDDDDAARLHGVVDANVESTAAFDPVERTLRTNDRDRLRRRLGEVRFEQLLAEGAALGLSAAIELASSLRPRGL